MTPPLNSEEIELLKKRMTIGALKLYKGRVGCTLAEAKLAIDNTAGQLRAGGLIPIHTGTQWRHALKLLKEAKDAIEASLEDATPVQFKHQPELHKTEAVAGKISVFLDLVNDLP